MEGSYRTDTDIYGESTLYIDGVMRAPYKLNRDDYHFCIFVLGNDLVTERFWSIYMPKKDEVTGEPNGGFKIENISETL